MTIAEQAWVTSAQNDEAAVHAMVLGRSLRRVVTSRKLVIVVSKCVHADIRIQLGKVFNAVIDIDNDNLNSTGIPVELMKNSDDLFDFPEFSILDEDSTASVFVFEPSVATFHKIVDFYACNHKSTATLSRFFSLADKNKNLSSDFNFLILEENSIPPTVKIVRFSGECLPWDFINKNRDMEKGRANIFVKQWLTIYQEEVEVFLSNRKECLDTIQEDSPSIKTDEEGLQDAIAIIGMSCRFPGANDVDEFWNLLENGQEGIRIVPEDRWQNVEHYACDPNVRKVESGFLSCPIDEFDGKFFNMSRRELDNIDPQQRLLMEITWEALENAAINPDTLKGTNAGVYTGIWTKDYHTLITKRPTTLPEFHRTYMGTSFAATSGRVSYHLGLTGPNIAIESGCSSSMVSLHLACENLRKGDSNLAIASGVNLILHPFTRESVAATHILAADGRCKTFDAKADGFGRAEGCAAIILKRYSDAVKDGDRILALIRGTGMSQEGLSSSFGTPSKYCQLISIQNALNDARVSPSDVSYVEAHGTGTIVGDPIEVSAISAAYGGERNEALYIGSVKTNIGHTESCAGLAGLIKVVLALNHNIIPPHRNLETLNPKIDLSVVPALINLEPVKWAKKEGKERMAGVSSFGISGANVHLIVQETPSKVGKSAIVSKMERPTHILTLSAKSEKALSELIEKYNHHLINSPNLALADTCYTANIGRAQFKYRTAVTGKNNADMSMKLKENPLKGKASELKSKVAFLFTGQGSQYVGMGKALYSTHPLFKDNMDRCSALLKTHGIDILEAMWGDKKQELDQSVYSQTGIFCVEYCLLKLWESFGVHPDCVLGHSLGEFVAAIAAGILKLEDAIKLVAARSKLVNNLPAGRMLAIKTDLGTVQRLIQEFTIGQQKALWIDIAVVNSDEEIVVAGRAASIEAFEAYCTSKKIKVQHIACKQAFHSRDMDMILKEYGEVASSISNGTSKCTYISGTTGAKAIKQLDSDYWLQHARESVNFKMGMQTALDQGCSVFIEIGAHPILLALGMNNVGHGQAQESIWLPSMRRNEDEWTTMLSSLAKLYVNGNKINWANFDSYYNRKKVTVPSYPFQREKYWYEGKVIQFTDMELNGKIIHPLLGKNIQTASSDIIYHNCVSLQNIVYVEDHKVGQKIVMPGAAFLEMILAGGHAATTAATEILPDPVTSIMVQDFKISAPLEITAGENIELQVVVSMKNDENETPMFQISVHRKKKDESGNISWIQHASGNFFPHVANQNLNESLDISKVKKRSVEISTKDVYQMLNHVGLNFGDKFQSISSFWKNGSEILAEIPIQDGIQVGSYLCHPVISDAMIQSIVLNSNQDRKNLYLPVAIEKYILVSKIPSTKVFAHVKFEKETSVRLYDSNGKLLTIMEGIQLISTNVSSFLNKLSLQKRLLPGLYQESWRNVGGTMSNRVDLSTVPSLNNILYELSDDLQEMERLEEIDLKFVNDSEKLSYMFIMSAFKEMGWVAKIGDSFNSWDFLTKFMISPRHQGLLERMFTILCEENILQEFNIVDKENERPRHWKIIGQPKQDDDLDSFKENLNRKIKNEVTIGDHVVVPLTIACGEKLVQFLQGKESPLGVLFPEVENETNAEKFYTHTGLSHRSNEIITKSIEICFRNTSGTLRICEIGAGTGSTTKLILNFLKKNNIKFKYTFTDISKVFLSKAKAKFSSEFKNVEYKLLNVEKDPKSQGFPPHHFDVIVAANVLHATQSLKESVSNIRHLLAPSGIFILFETLTPHRTLDITFGLIEGYWRFNDFDLRPYHALINADKWQNLIRSSGFENVTLLKSSGERGGVIISRSAKLNAPCEMNFKLNNSDIWVLFVNDCKQSKSLVQEMRTIGKTVITVEKSKTFLEICENYQYAINPSEQSDVVELLKSIEKGGVIEGIIYLWGIEEESMDQKRISEPFLYISQHILTADIKNIPKLLVVTRGVAHIGDQSVNKNISDGTLWGFARTIKSEQPLLNCTLIDTDPDEVNEELAAKEIISEIWNMDSEWQISYRDRKRHVLRINHLESSKTLHPPNTERFQLILPTSNKIADLNIGSAVKSVLGEDDVEVCITGTALNFRDLFIILKPDMFKSLYDAAVGTDFSGIITEIGCSVKKFKVGDKVFGLCSTGAFSSHAVVSSHLVALKPKNWTLLEAACLPSVFLTAYYCLVDIAKLKPRDTILIHVASGGVGLVAIQIAQEIGATIIATAGSKRKRQYLKNLGIKLVFHSRNISFGEEIEKITGGKGVDVVLNSLTGPNFKETSLRVCAKNARFVEMSKINVWQPEEVIRQRPDVKYWIVDLEKAHPETMKHLVAKMEDGLARGVIRPLPYVRFELSQSREAFNYFQKAHHIGKIVVAMPKIAISKGRLMSTELLFNDESTYVITGGLGGIGIEVAKWMVELGAKFVALIGRHVPDETASKAINSLNSKFSANVISLQVDVGDMSECEKMFQVLENNYPPVRGIMHAAGKISDGILTNQTWNKFETAYNAKVKGGWNLHRLTKALNLEHFVLFSSVAATLGPISQSNHASANTFLDTLAHFRHSIGLPAQSINWGAWSEVGAAVNLVVGTEGAFGIKPFSPSQGLAGLNAILKSHETQVSVLEVDFAALKMILPHLGTIVGDMVKENISNTEATMGSDSFWKGMHGLNMEQRIPYIKTQVETIIRLVLKLPDCESIDENQKFSEMGMDSLMAVELRNCLQSLCGKQLTLNTAALVDYPTTISLSHYLTELTCTIDEYNDDTRNEGQNLKTATVNAVENVMDMSEESELRQLVQEDSKLPVHIKCRSKMAVKPSEVRSLFLTGVTGQLGPYLLQEMSKNQNITVYCLIRAKNNETAQKKLNAALEKNHLTLVHNNIIGIAGSIVEHHFGLPENVYFSLAEKVDAVWHMAVKSNHLEKYRKCKESIKTDLRSVNVLATKRILEFATEIKTKRVLYASSLVATNKTSDDGTMSETLPELENNGEGITMGYSVSKFVCEKLIAEAMKREIPCQVLRYPVLAGDSQTGRFFVESNHFMIVVMTCMQLGVLPNTPQGFISLPVDAAAKLTLGIFFNDDSGLGVFNINNPHGGNQDAFLKVAAEFGHPMELVNFAQFREKLEKLGENSLLYSFKDIYIKEGGYEQFMSSSAVFRMKGQDSANWSAMSEKVKRCVPNAEEIIALPEDSIRKHLQYAKNSDINILFGL